jgi:hypothetical protein
MILSDLLHISGQEKSTFLLGENPQCCAKIMSEHRSSGLFEGDTPLEFPRGRTQHKKYIPDRNLLDKDFSTSYDKKLDVSGTLTHEQLFQGGR